MNHKTAFFLLLFILSFCFTSIAQTDTARYFTSFDNSRIYYEIKGEGYPVVMLHGFMNTSQNWKRCAVYKALLDAGYKLIVLDLRGNGKSSKPHTDEAYAHDAEAKDVMGLASALQLNHYDVVGYSRGSIIAARLLVLDTRVHKAVMGGMGTDFTNPEWARRKMFYRALRGDKVQELSPVIQRIHNDTTLDQTALMFQQKEQPSTPIGMLQKVTQPVLVVCGDKDSDNGNAKALADVFQHSQFVTVPGVHGFAVTTPEFANAVVTFLELK